MSAKRIRTILIIVALLAFAVTLWAYVSKRNNNKVTYLTETVRRGDVVRTVNAVGEISAGQMVDVGAQVSGQIMRLHVHLGQEVRKGDLVAEIDSTTQENELMTNQARLTTYRAQLAARQVALKIAQTRYERERKLRQTDATSRESLEDAENTLALAKAEVEELKSLIEQTEIAVSTSEVNLGYTRILSPLDGTVVNLAVEEGQTVNANQTTPTIVRIADLSQMEIRIQISEGDVTRVAPGMEVSYTILSEPNRTFSTTIRSIDPGLTTLTDGTYTGATTTDNAVFYYGKLLVPNDEGKLRIGMTTQSSIIIAAARNVLTVPSIAIRHQGGKSLVQVLDSRGRVEDREIVTGISDSLNTEVISGLQEGDEVVSSQMSRSEINSSGANMRRGAPRF